jgi:hypothetical protein
MSKISNLIATETITEVEYPDIDGFILKIAYLSREDLVKIRNQSLTYKFNKRTRQREEEIDQDKFLEAYTKKAIRGWKGLKLKNLPQLLPVDLTGVNLEENVAYSEEEALELIKNSSVFDQFITDCMNDFEQFSVTKKAEAEKN